METCCAPSSRLPAASNSKPRFLRVSTSRGSFSSTCRQCFSASSVGPATATPAALRKMRLRTRTPGYYGGAAGRSRFLGAAVEDVVWLDVLNGRAADEVDRVGEAFDTAMVVPAQHRGVLHHETRVIVPVARHATGVGQSDEKLARAQVVRCGVVEIFEQHERRAERMVNV